MDAVLRDALKMVRMIIPPNIRMEADIDGLHTNVFGSATQLHQVLLNLCSNAYQSMEDSGGVLTVSTRRVPLAKMIQPAGNTAEWVCVQVSDTGCGIPEDDLKHIFDPFLPLR